MSSCYGSRQTNTQSLDGDVVVACISKKTNKCLHNLCISIYSTQEFVKDHYDVSKSVLVMAINDKCA